MATRLYTDVLEDGSIPVYACEDGPGIILTLTERGQWEERRFGKLLVNMGIDGPLSRLERQLPALLGALPDGPAGHVLLVIRHAMQHESIVYGEETLLLDALVMGGLAHCADPRIGAPSNGFLTDDPAYAIVQTLRGIAGLEYDRNVGGVQDAIVARMRRKQERERDHLRALAKATALLKGYLDPEQLAQYELDGAFRVRGADGCLYLIVEKAMHNVFQIDEEGRRLMEFCLVTEITSPVPVQDLMLAQKFLLEAAPDQFRERANTWDLTGDERTLVHKDERGDDRAALALLGRVLRREVRDNA